MTPLPPRRTLACVLALGTAAFGFTAQAQPGPPVRAEQPWARATAPQQQVGAAYVTLTSPAADRLVSATSPAAGKVEVHEMRMDGTVMQMRELPDGLPLPAGQPVILAPGGYHIMLVGLRHPLKAGESVPVQLRFEHAPPLDLQFVVGAPGARGPGQAGAGPTGMGQAEAAPGSMPAMPAGQAHTH